LTRERKKLLWSHGISKKEILAAIIMGLLVGIIATIYSTGIWKNVLSIFPLKKKASPLVVSPMPSLTVKKELKLIF